MAEISNEDDTRKYVERKIAEIRKSAISLFLGEREIAKKLNQIIDETECFANQCEIPEW